MGRSCRCFGIGRFFSARTAALLSYFFVCVGLAWQRAGGQSRAGGARCTVGKPDGGVPGPFFGYGPVMGWRSVLGTQRSALCTRRPFPGTQRSALCTRRPFPGTQRSTHGTRRPFPGTQRSALCTRRPFPGTQRSTHGIEWPTSGTEWASCCTACMVKHTPASVHTLCGLAAEGRSPSRPASRACSLGEFWSVRPHTHSGLAVAINSGVGTQRVEPSPGIGPVRCCRDLQTNLLLTRTRPQLAH